MINMLSIQHSYAWVVEQFAKIGLDSTTSQKMIWSFFLLCIYFIIRRVFFRSVIGRIHDPKTQYQWRKTFSTTSLFIFLLFLLRIWTQGAFGGIATFLGLTGAGLALALKDPILNFFGWIYILTRRPLDLGQRIEINNVIGDVIDIGIFELALLEILPYEQGGQSTGRIVYIPNSFLFSKVYKNFDKGLSYIWVEMPVMVTFESDWKTAKAMLTKIVEKTIDTAKVKKSLRKVAGKYMIKYSNLTPKVYTSVVDSGVLLTMRYLVKPRQKRNIEEELWEEILEAFAQDKTIDFAYPTRRAFTNIYEGKQASPQQVPTPSANPLPV